MQGAAEDGGDDDKAAEDGPAAGGLAHAEEDPEGIEDRFDDGDHDAVDGGGSPDGDGIENVGEAQLEESHDNQVCPTSGGRLGADHKRKADQGGEDIAQEDRTEGVAGFLLAHEENETAEKHAAHQGKDVAPEAGEGKLVQEEYTNAQDGNADGADIEPGNFFIEEQAAQDGHIDGGGVLQEDGVGGGGQFGGDDKEDDRAGVADGPAELGRREI